MNLRSQQCHRKDSYLKQFATCKTSLCLKAHLLCKTKNNLKMGFCLDCFLLFVLLSGKKLIIKEIWRYIQIEKPFNLDILRSLGPQKQIAQVHKCTQHIIYYMTCAEGIIWDTYEIKLLSVRSSQARNWSSFKKPDSKLLLGMSKAQAQANSKKKKNCWYLLVFRNDKQAGAKRLHSSLKQANKKQHTFCFVVPDKCQAQEVLDE